MTIPQDLIVARDVNTPVARLKKLAATKDKIVLAALIKNPNTPQDLLIELAYYFLDEISSAPVKQLACKLFCLNILKELVADRDDIDVKRAVAEHKHTPVSILELLARNEDNWVRSVVAEHENSPISILEILAEDREEYVRYNVASNQNTPTYILERLAGDRSFSVKHNVVNNKNTPLSVLQQLAKDRCRSIAELARSAIARVL